MRRILAFETFNVSEEEAYSPSKYDGGDEITFSISDGVTNSEDKILEEVILLRRKLVYALKMIENIKVMLHEYENMDHGELINIATVND